VGTEYIEHTPPLTCGYYSYWSGVPSDSAEVYFGDDRTHIIFPTNDDLTVVIALWPVDRFPEIRRGAEGHYMAALESAPLIADRIRSGRREERLLGGGDVDNYIRRSAGPGWALVGDAGYHKDPTPADGITDAFTGAALLSEAADSFLSGQRPEDESMNDYQRQRDEMAVPHLSLTLSISSLDTPIEKRVADFGENAALRYMEALAISQATQQATLA
jgi:flavin-dependent dehydrogenase